MVAKIIKGQFEALNFANDKFGEKLCYLRLSERLDPQQVVERIQTMTKFDAFIPDDVPDVSIYIIEDSNRYPHPCTCHARNRRCDVELLMPVCYTIASPHWNEGVTLAVSLDMVV